MSVLYTTDMKVWFDVSDIIYKPSIVNDIRFLKEYA